MALQKVGPYEVDPNEPWKNDKLDRKKVADYLTPVIASVTQPFTISLHSPYGTGKTSFILSWQADLRNQGYKTVYFNAWETDFSHDAFFAFMSAFQRELEDQAPNKQAATSIAKKVAKSTKKGAGIVVEKALPLIVRGLTKKLAGDETVEGVLTLLGQSDDAIGELAGTLAEEGLKSQREAEKSRLEFKADLEKTVVSLFDLDTSEEKRKVLIFVDDLDRCRPSYAIQVLEAIKHLFSVTGLLFILSVDEEQLKSAVHSVYGVGIDSEGYLRKFRDWSFVLPDPDHAAYIVATAHHFSLPTVRDWGKWRVGGFEDFIRVMCLGSSIFNISLRETNFLMSNMNLVCRAVKGDDLFFPRQLGLIAILHHVFPLDVERAVRFGSKEPIQKRLQQVEGADLALRHNAELSLDDELGLIFSDRSKKYALERMRTLSDQAFSHSGLNGRSAARARDYFGRVVDAIQARLQRAEPDISIGQLCYAQIKDAQKLQPMIVHGASV